MERAGWGREEEEGGDDKHLWFVCFLPPLPMLKCSDCKGRRAKEDDAVGLPAQLIAPGWEMQHLHSSPKLGTSVPA